MHGVEQHLLAQEKMFNIILDKFEKKLLTTTYDTYLIVFITGFFCGVCCITVLLTLRKRKQMQSLFSRSTVSYL